MRQALTANPSRGGNKRAAAHAQANGARRTGVAQRQPLEAALLEANAVIELALEGISKLDDIGRYVFVNAQYAALLGYCPEGLQACWSQPILNSSGTVLGTFAAYYREPRAPQPNDLILVERASHIAALAIEHARVSKAMRESEARFQAFMTHNPAVSFIKDSAGRHLYINLTFERLFGISLCEIRGKTLDDRLPSDVVAQLRRNDEKVLSSGQPVEVEETVPTPDGNSQHWMVLKFPLTASSGERLLGGVAIGITARKQAEEHSRQSEAFVTSVLEHLPHMVFVKEASDLRFVRINRAGEVLLGKVQGELLGMTDHNLFPKPEADFFTTKDREVLANGSLVDIPEETIHTAAGPRILHTKKLPIFGVDGTPVFARYF